MDTFSSQFTISVLVGLVLGVVIVLVSDRVFGLRGTQQPNQTTKDEITTTNKQHSHGVTFEDADIHKQEQHLLEKRVNKLQKVLGRSQEEVERKLLPQVMRTRSKSKAKKLLGVDDTELALAKKQSETTRQQISYVTKYAKQLTKVLGIDESEVLDAVRTANQTSSSSSQSKAFWQRDGTTMMDQPTNWVKILDTCIFLVMIAVFCYFVQLSTQGNFGRVLAGIFPREFETLGLKQYMERI